jgi:hypothetical protein
MSFQQTVAACTPCIMAPPRSEVAACMGVVASGHEVFGMRVIN